jgi:UDP-4-amino-4,6-dideoxy-N-acetyl-beta-L-altrosamine transaminase
MIPYGRQDISQADIDAVVEVLRSDWLTQGPMVPKFEQAVANYVGAQHAVALNSATSALHIACLALGVGPGDWVWTSPNTFVASANCALYCGARVDFVDIDPRTYNMSVERLAEKLEQAEAANRLPKVVIPVHFAGQPCDMRAIRELSQQYGFKIIEDASHAIGASYVIASEAKQSTDQVMVGSCTHSHITVFSFHPVKIITTGEGGMALTNDPELAEKLSRLRTHGITSKAEFMYSRPPEEIWNYQQIDLGFNYRMTDIQAALGLSQLQRLDDFVANRREIAAKYDRALSNLPVTTPWQDPRMQSSYHLYPILIEHERCGRRQREVYQAMHQAGILVNLHYIPVHRQPYYERMGFEQGYCPNAEQYHRAAISLPMYSSLTGEQQQKVVTTLKDVLNA